MLSKDFFFTHGLFRIGCTGRWATDIWNSLCGSLHSSNLSSKLWLPWCLDFLFCLNSDSLPEWPLPVLHVGNSFNAWDRENIGSSCLFLISQGSLSLAVWYPVSWRPLFRLFYLVFWVVSGKRVNLVLIPPWLEEIHFCFSSTSLWTHDFYTFCLF